LGITPLFANAGDVRMSAIASISMWAEDYARSLHT
jgi:hypothetical protein